jgi:hypothetical protein
MSKKKEFFEELVQIELFEELPAEVVVEETVVEEAEVVDPGNKTRAFRA